MYFKNYFNTFSNKSGILKLRILYKHYSNLICLKTKEAKYQAEFIARKMLNLIKQLSNSYQKKTIEKIIGLSIFSLMGLINSPTAKAQNFLSQVPVDYNFVKDSLTVVFPNLVDIDNDGDLDIMSAVFPIDPLESYFGFTENIGTATTPIFDTLRRDPFSLPAAIINPDILARNDFADMDGDGDLDMLGVSIYDAEVNQMFFFENIGSPESPEFGPIETTNLTSDFETSWAPTAISDIDQDGDLDLLSLVYYFDSNDEVTYQVIWLENKGSSSNMEFDGFVPLSVAGLHEGLNAYAIPGLELKDFDNDGDDDILLIGSSYDFGYKMEFIYYENLGNLSYSNPSLLDGLTSIMGVPVQELVTAGDIDGDGDVDILSEVFFPNSFQPETSYLHFIENLSSVNTDNLLNLAGFFEIHPNPLESPIILNYEIESSQKIQMGIFDSQGKLLLEKKYDFVVGRSSFEIDINSLNPGFYFLKLTGESGSKAMKFIVR